MIRLTSGIAAIAMVALTGVAQAALVDRGGGMIYDTTRHLTWLADMSYARTSGYTGPGVTAFGTMTWDAAITWADNLVYGGFSDWRLPTVNPTDPTCRGSNVLPGIGSDCTEGELSGLFVSELGNKADESVLEQTGDTAEQRANLALFSNVQSSLYWSGTEYVNVHVPAPDLALLFNTVLGYQQPGSQGGFLYAVAVRPGDVASGVPEPQTLALALLALGATAAVCRKRLV